MKNSTILRTAKVGGFNKEDVLTYVDELNAKIESLKTELDKAKEEAVNPAEIEEYKNEIVRLNQLVNDNEKAVSDIRTAADAEKSEIRTEMESKINEISEENTNLKNTIESLEYQLEEAKNNVQTASAEVVPVDTSAFENEISDLKVQLENARNQITEMSGEMTKLSDDISEKGRTIQKLTLENDELRLQTDENSFSSNFDMGALFSEAQSTAKKIVVEARIAADKLVRDAEYEADKILSEANKKADSINSEAVSNASNIETQARKDAKAAVDVAEYLKDIFRKQMEKVVVQLDTLSESINNSKEEISENVNDFVEGKTGLDKAISDAEKISATDCEDEFSLTDTDSYYVASADDYAQEKEDMNNESSEVPYMSSVANYEPEEEVTEAMTDNLMDTYSENVKSYDENELEDILSSFAIDPDTVADDEAVNEVKNSPALGFNLDDLAKLAEEAENDF